MSPTPAAAERLARAMHEAFRGFWYDTHPDADEDSSPGWERLAEAKQRE